MVEPGWKTKMNEQNQQMKGDLHVKVRELEEEIERLRKMLEGKEDYYEIRYTAVVYRNGIEIINGSASGSEPIDRDDTKRIAALKEGEADFD